MVHGINIFGNQPIFEYPAGFQVNKGVQAKITTHHLGWIH
jgi:hypothetical protein